jgi:hypothetical protein
MARYKFSQRMPLRHPARILSHLMAYYAQAPVAVAQQQYYSKPSPSYSSGPSMGSKARGHRMCDTCGKVETAQTGRFRLCGGCMVTQYCVCLPLSAFASPFAQRFAVTRMPKIKLVPA